jgi:hypothetical protein
MEGKLGPTRWICGCLITEHPRWECLKMTPAERVSYKARIKALESTYKVSSTLQELFVKAAFSQNCV